MTDQYTRTRAMIGDKGLKRLQDSRVAVFGIGGVGSYAAEALARAGVGTIDLIDGDQVDVTNINRQLIACRSTVGKDKVQVMKARIFDIDPSIRVNAHCLFFLPEIKFDLSGLDYVIDAVDTVTAKLELTVRAKAAGVPVISSMGTGNKLDPSRFEVTTIDKTSVCPLAKVMRRELKKRGITDLKVVYSREQPFRPQEEVSGPRERRAPASISFVPPVAGMILAGEVIRDLLNEKTKRKDG